MAELQTIHVPSRVQDLTGQTFDYWSVLAYAGHTANLRTLWRCRCHCGTEAVRAGDVLKKGESHSCGCMSNVLRQKWNLARAVRRVEVFWASQTDAHLGVIHLPRGIDCLIDPSDIAVVSRFKWSGSLQNGKRYVSSTSRQYGPSVLMHVLLMGRRRGFLTDHINGNGLDNRRSNLRWATCAQNQANKRHQRNARSPYKGAWPPSSNHPKWRAAITHAGVRYFLGVFDSAEGAARAYDSKAKELFGEFAKLNFPEE
jgi:hypothetical protein